MGKRGLLFGLLRASQRVLNDSTLPVDRQHETVWCHRSVQSSESNIPVYRARDGSDASVHGLQTCGNVWTCPVCSAKLAEARRRELQLGLVNWLEQGRAADGAQRHGGYLLTLTFSHDADDPLSVLLVRQAKALGIFKRSAAYAEVWKSFGRKGSVRGLEVTHGKHGWHPHTHDLVFGLAGLLEDRAAIRALKRAWLWACIKADLVPGVSVAGRRRRLTIKAGEGGSRLAAIRNHWRHALDIRGGDQAAEYIAKFGRDERWGITSELARANAKLGVKKTEWSADLHFSPFQLLQWAANGDDQAAALFREFAAAIKGRRALSWSPGLKTSLGVRDATDEELLGEADAMPERTGD